MCLSLVDLLTHNPPVKSLKTTQERVNRKMLTTTLDWILKEKLCIVIFQNFAIFYNTSECFIFWQTCFTLTFTFWMVFVIGCVLFSVIFNKTDYLNLNIVRFYSSHGISKKATYEQKWKVILMSLVDYWKYRFSFIKFIANYPNDLKDTRKIVWTERLKGLFPRKSVKIASRYYV